MENDNDILAQRLRSIRRPSLPDGMVDSIMGRIRRRERRQRAGRIALAATLCTVAVTASVWGLSFIKPDSLSPLKSLFLSAGDSFRDIFGRIAAFVSTDHGKIMLITAATVIFYLFLGEAIAARLKKKAVNDPAT